MNWLKGRRENESSESYWTRHNVTLHRKFATPEESFDFIEWRNLQHPNYIDLMPVKGMDGLAVLDYGCGPGHDLVGFASESKPNRLVGMDVSSTSLAEAEDRMGMHGFTAEFKHIREDAPLLPLQDNSMDVIHSSGVLHHTPDPVRILREFRRVLRPGGYSQVMVYNYDSVWTHLHVAYQRMLVEGLFPGKSLREAFTASTDGPECPISVAYTPDEFMGMCREAGFSPVLSGCAISAWEMTFVPKIWDALLDKRLPSESRRFLSELTFDSRGIPWFKGVVAGVDACYRLHPC